MADARLPAHRANSVPPATGNVGRSADLPAGNHWLGFERDVIVKNTSVVDNSTGYLLARRRQSDAYAALIDARMRIAEKIAELADLPHRIAAEQRAREHVRDLDDKRHELERLNADIERRLAAARAATELARIEETSVRATRNLEAAQRVKESEIDRWQAEAEARRNNAAAERADTLADLQRPLPPPGGEPGHSFADLLDHQIELERQRGNEHAVMALLNLRARIKAT